MPRYYSVDKGYSRSFLICTAVFIAVILTSNIISTKIISVGEVISTAGVLIFPLSYILGDILTEVYGFRKMKMVIWLGFFVNFFFVLVTALARIVPSAPYWLKEEAFEEILGPTPRLLLASFAGYLSGSFVNSILMAKIKLATGGRRLWERIMISTFAGEAIDTVLFVLIIFIGSHTVKEILSIFWLNWLLKTSYEFLLLPVTYWAIIHLKSREKMEIFDYDTKFNPLAS